MADEIDNEYLNDIAKGKVKFPDGSAEAHALDMLEEAGRALVDAKAKKREGQRMMAEGHIAGIAAEAERTAAAKMLTRLKRSTLPQE